MELDAPLDSASRLRAGESENTNETQLIFIDLRPAKDFQASRLPGARSIPFWDFLKRYREVPRAGRVILYCDCPVLELQDPYRFLWEQGYRNLSVLEDGFKGWTKRGYAVER